MNEKVFVYRNLRKDCWSIRSVKTGLVIGYAEELVMKDCKFKVSEAGRQRVLKEKRKNVHAGVEGFLCDGLLIAGTSRPVKYNPYHNETFVYGGTDTPVTEGKYVVLSKDFSVHVVTDDF